MPVGAFRDAQNNFQARYSFPNSTSLNTSTQDISCIHIYRHSSHAPVSHAATYNVALEEQRPVHATEKTRTRHSEPLPDSRRVAEAHMEEEEDIAESVSEHARSEGHRNPFGSQTSVVGHRGRDTASLPDVQLCASYDTLPPPYSWHV